MYLVRQKVSRAFAQVFEKQTIGIGGSVTIDELHNH